MKHLLPDSVSPPSSPAQQRSRSLRVGGGGEGGAGRRNRSHSVHHVLLSTIKTTPLQRSFCHFEKASKYCILDSFVDYDGYSISSKRFLPTVVDIMVI